MVISVRKTVGIAHSRAWTREDGTRLTISGTLSLIRKNVVDRSMNATASYRSAVRK